MGVEVEADVCSRVAPRDQSGRGYLLTPEMPEEKKTRGSRGRCTGGTDALAMAARVWGVGVGGAVVLLAVIVGLWLLRRKRKAKPNVHLVATAEPVFPTAYTPPSFNPSFYNQSPDSGQRRSPWGQDDDWERSEQNRVWRPPL